MNLRFIDWIWHVRGGVALAHGQSRDDTFDRLAPLFSQPGTSHEITGDTLVFSKRNQAAQDRMSVFDGGILQIGQTATGPVLRYDMTSRILLFCCLLPPLFLGIAQLTVAMGMLEKPATALSHKPGKAADVERKHVDKKADVPMNPIDKALGAPAPDKKKDADEDKDKKPSPTAAYVFAAIFTLLYIVGRILEDRLARSLLRNSLLAAPPSGLPTYSPAA